MQPFETGRPLIGVWVGIGLPDPQACAHHLDRQHNGSQQRLRPGAHEM